MRRVPVVPVEERVSRKAAPTRKAAPSPGSPLTPQALLELQRTGGNRAVQRLLAAPAERTLARFNDQLVRERAYQVKDWVEAKIQVRAHEIFTATKNTDDKANYYEAKKQVEEAWQHFTTLQSGGTITDEQRAVMKLGLSSDEYARALAVEGKAMGQGDLLELTVGDFDKHRKSVQMDWANQPFDAPTRNAVWQVVDWGLDGLTTIKLADVVREMANPASFTYIKHYCEALTGKLNGGPTVELARQNALADVLRHGKWVGELTTALGGPRIRAVMPKAVFSELVEDETVAAAFADYYTTRHPILEAPDGSDTLGFITLVRDEKARISDYTGQLTHIKNYHKFAKASLDKLLTDKTAAGRPLTLVFQSLFDHNGAFVRHAHVNAVIQNAKIRAYAIEGQSESELKALAKTGIAQLAAAYGLDGKITQVMIAGHGESTSMELGGEGSDVEQEEGTGEYRVTAGDEVPLEFTGRWSDKFWTKFFEALFSNMEMKGGLQPTILLRACLTASNAVDTNKLKAEMKQDSRIDVNDPHIDPTTPDNQAKIREGIVEYIKRHGSLAKVIGDKATGRAEVKGAQASITTASTGSIVEATGQLDIVALDDPTVAGPKIQYVRHGKEPLGALRAVIESWAEDETACFAEIDKRLADGPAATDSEFIIRQLYETIKTQYRNDILTANALTDTASVLDEIAAGADDCRPKALRNDLMTQVLRPALYPTLIGRFANKFAKLAIYQDWLSLDAAKATALIDHLGDPDFKREAVKNYLDFKMLDSHVGPMLTGGASVRGRIMLALVGLIEHKRTDCKDFLATQVDSNDALTADVKNTLGDFSENELRKLLGLSVEAAPVVSGARPKNIGGGDFHVEPVQATVKATANASATDAAKLLEAPDDGATEIERQDRATDYEVVGEVKTLTGADAGWYMIRRATGTVGYVRTRYF